MVVCFSQWTLAIRLMFRIFSCFGSSSSRRVSSLSLVVQPIPNVAKPIGGHPRVVDEVWYKITWREAKDTMWTHLTRYTMDHDFDHPTMGPGQNLITSRKPRTCHGHQATWANEVRKNSPVAVTRLLACVGNKPSWPPNALSLGCA